MKLNPKTYLVLAAVAVAAITTAYASRAPADAEISFDSDLVAFLKRFDYALLSVTRYNDKPSGDGISLDGYSLANSNPLLWKYIGIVDKAYNQSAGSSSQFQLSNVQVAITRQQADTTLKDIELKPQQDDAEAKLDIYSGDVELGGRYYQLTLMFPK